MLGAVYPILTLSKFNVSSLNFTEQRSDNITHKNLMSHDSGVRQLIAFGRSSYDCVSKALQGFSPVPHFCNTNRTP